MNTAIDHTTSAKSIACDGYIHGILDGLVLGSFGTYCAPSGGVSVTQGRLIVEKFMRNHPETLHEQAGNVAALAMMTVFPCKGKNSN
jgi:hypothetical protein